MTLAAKSWLLARTRRETARTIVQLVLLWAGCGRVSFGLLDPSSGASRDGAPATDDDGGGSAALGDALDTAGACASPVVMDTFDDGVLDPAWTNSLDPSIALFESGSHLVFEYGSPANSASKTALTSPVIDLRMRCVTVTVASVRGLDNAVTALEVGGLAGKIRIQVVGTQLIGVDEPLTAVPTAITFDPVAHARWRVQLGGGRVLALAVDSSGNPTKLLRDVPAWFDESMARINLYSSVTSGNVNGGTAELDAIEY